MNQAVKAIRASMVAAALVCSAGLGVGVCSSNACLAAPTMCPPSEGEFDFEGVDISGDGMVMLPETVRFKAVASTSKADAEGKLVVDKRVALVVQDPAKADRTIMAMRLTPTAAEEVREWLASAVESQEKFITENKVTEKPGIECTLDAKRCRELAAGTIIGNGKKTDESKSCAKTCEKKSQQATIPAMWVTVTSQGDNRHGWSTMTAASPAPAAAPGGCRSGLKDAANVAAAPADQRIAITTYDRSAGGRPLTVRLDTPTAKQLLADLGRAIDERNGKIQPAPAEQKQETTTSSAS